MNNKWFLFLVTIIYIIIYCSGRFILIKTLQINDHYYSFDYIMPVALDMIFALTMLAISLIVKRISIVVSFIFITVFTLFHLSNMEYIFALNNVINLSDIHYVGDKTFLLGTLSHLNFPIYTSLLLLVCILFVIALKRYNSSKKIKRSLLLGIFVLFIFQILLTPSYSSWIKGNFIYLSFYNSFNFLNNNLKQQETYSEEEKKAVHSKIFPSDIINQGEPLIPGFGKNKNVLLVVLEGIPGIYVQEVQNFTGIDYDIKMNSFDKVINNSVVVPNFLTHNNQTIRGLYSLLTGDYPKLDASTPKAYEYINLQEDQKIKALPQILKEKGYFTAFLQAAPLEFMSKDQFMESIGFEEILGKDDFSYQYVPFGWGIDDKAFFEQVANYIQDLNNKDKPWFLTLLTVGTHHPYGVPNEYEKKYSNRKEASIHYLDDALGKFIDFLKSSEIDKDTIVLFVSDESHGVDGISLGGNWGLCLAYSPEIKKTIINDNVYGQIDILPSIIDYIDPDSTIKGRSIFRKYSKNRPILFASHYSGDVFFSKQKGIIQQINKTSEFFEIRSLNGQMFSREYEIEKINDELNKKILIMYQHVSNLNLSNISNNNTNNQILIIKHKTYKLENIKPEMITSGQSLTIPKNSLVTIKFDYNLRDSSSNLNAIRFLLNTPNNKKLITKVIDNKKQKGTLIYQFYTPEGLVLFSIDLFAIPYFNKHFLNEIEMDISNLTISYKRQEGNYKDLEFTNDFKIYDMTNVINIENLIPLMTIKPYEGFPTFDDEIVVSPSGTDGILVYGPYLSYPKGNYILEYKLKLIGKDDYNVEKALFVLDVVTEGKILSKKEFYFNDLKKNGEYYVAQIPFTITKSVQDLVEFRLKLNQPLNIVINKISTQMM